MTKRRRRKIEQREMFTQAAYLQHLRSSVTYGNSRTKWSPPLVVPGRRLDLLVPSVVVETASVADLSGSAVRVVDVTPFDATSR